MPTWPPDLPFFDAFDGRQRGAPKNAVLRTPMSLGPDKVRRRTTAAPVPYSGVTGKMTKAQLIQFQTFFDQDLNYGATEFTATDPFDCVDKTFSLLDYQIIPHGTGVRISGTLEIWP